MEWTLRQTEMVVTEPSSKSPSNEIIYPSEDGKPMAESDFQRLPLTYAIESLRKYFDHDEQIYVSGDLLIYYEEGNPAKSVAPDVFVVVGVSNVMRHSYKIWEEGKGPDVVIEILSESTWKKDVEEKPKLYSKLGVREYYLYDPQAKFMKPSLQGRWLNKTGQYQPMAVTKLPDGTLAVDSHLLGLELRVAPSDELRFFDPQTAAYLYTYGEQDAARRQAEVARFVEAEARRQAESARLMEAEARRQAEQKLREAEEKLRRAGLL